MSRHLVINSLKVSVAALLLFAVGPAVADSVNGAATSGQAAVTVMNPITVTQTQGLNFGAVTSGAAGTVSIDPIANTRAVSGGVGAVAADVGQPGTFQITGLNNAVIQIVVAPTITGFAGGITGVTSHSALVTQLPGTVTNVSVGGTLTIPANTPPGQYTGSFSVSVSYP